MKTPHKTWQTPQVFVLGAESTTSTKKTGQFEGTTHVDGITFNTKGGATIVIPGSTSIPVGYAS